MPEEVLVLDRTQVRRCAARIDPVAVTEEVLRRHARAEVMLPAEGYMAWRNSEGAYSRSIAMLGALTGSDPVYGLKLINASVGNPSKGMERAGGISLLFDPETARPRLLAEAGYLSALRTAAYTVASLRRLGPESFDAVSVIGCGTLARAHLELIGRYLPQVTRVHAFDTDARRGAGFARWAAERGPAMRVESAPSARACVAASRVVITLTVSDKPYAEIDWFRPGSFVAHVSLDDLCEDVFAGAERLYVDDVQLIAENPRRILGRLLQEGAILPGDAEVADPAREVRRGVVSGTLGEVLIGKVPAARPTDGVVVSNPFGMSILDVGMVNAIRGVAERDGLGTRINLLGTDGEAR
ncbi:ornithine cyclodeaminase [Streptomyces sp. ME19-01-6]|uniref:ornithine cyclodeaminase n=1 Tax=Streptomyces sp. ME19-01-6 TaxID=3028686 RepID=UPI0029B32739|nr:ornithine cyclodeaminase [Streptomyces sp. ME19-01-6]MDX3229599.1 ornithine cyclodeaminase [Streptomyces sp. ME19-01-6]